MLKSIIAFGLTHRTIVIMGLLVFLGGGYVAFTNLNIEAYPNPAPVILEITAQQAGLSQPIRGHHGDQDWVFASLTRCGIQNSLIAGMTGGISW